MNWGDHSFIPILVPILGKRFYGSYFRNCSARNECPSHSRWISLLPAVGMKEGNMLVSNAKKEALAIGTQGMKLYESIVDVGHRTLSPSSDATVIRLHSRIRVSYWDTML